MKFTTQRKQDKIGRTAVNFGVASVRIRPPTRSNRRSCINLRCERSTFTYSILIAAPTIKIQLPPKLRDSGWAHYDHRDRRDNREKSGMDAAKSEIEKRLTIRGLAIRGNYEIAEQGTLNPRDCSFYCCLIEV